MVWEPFALAILFGLLVSAGIYFVFLWPQVAPDDDLPDAAAEPPAGAMRLTMVLNTSATDDTRPGMALSGHSV